MMRPVLILLISLVIFLGFCPHSISSDQAEIDVDGDMKLQRKTNKNKRKNWSKVDFNTLEKEWEEGDDKRELAHDFELNREAHQKNSKKINKTKKGAQKSASDDPLGLNRGSGGTMMFAKLRQRGVAWTSKEIGLLAAKWSQLLRSASMDVRVVDISKQGGLEDDTGTLLLSIDRAWNTYDMMKFTLNQPETAKVTLNSKDYTTADLPDEEDY